MWPPEAPAASLECAVLDRVAACTGRRATRVARLVTSLGETPVVWSAVTAAAAYTGWRSRSWSPCAGPVITLAAGAGTRRLLAQVLGRPRPPRRLWRTGWSGASFPSRHTTLAVIGTGLAAQSLVGQIPAEVAALSVGAAVAVSRLVLGVHWPTDVLAGWAFGAAVLAARHLPQLSAATTARTAITARSM